MRGICRAIIPDDMPTAMKPCCAVTAVLLPGACMVHLTLSSGDFLQARRCCLCTCTLLSIAEGLRSHEMLRLPMSHDDGSTE